MSEKTQHRGYILYDKELICDVSAGLLVTPNQFQNKVIPY